MDRSYKEASLETVACLWEEVLELMRGLSEDKERNTLVEAARERMGTPHLRMVVIGWVDAADEDWATVKEECWDKPYDWEWIPEWIAANVDWTTDQPTLRSPRTIPGGHS